MSASHYSFCLATFANMGFLLRDIAWFRRRRVPTGSPTPFRATSLSVYLHTHTL